MFSNHYRPLSTWRRKWRWVADCWVSRRQLQVQIGWDFIRVPAFLTCMLLLYAKSWTRGGGRRKMRADDSASLSSADIPECINSFTSLCCEFWSAFLHKELVMLCSLIVLCALFELWNFCIVQALSGCEELSEKTCAFLKMSRASEVRKSGCTFQVFFTRHPTWFMFKKTWLFKWQFSSITTLQMIFFVFFVGLTLLLHFARKRRSTVSFPSVTLLHRTMRNQKERVRPWGP